MRFNSSWFPRINGSMRRQYPTLLLSTLPNSQSYIPSKWFQDIQDKRVKDSALPELMYVVVKRTASLPSFDTRFTDYGFNRQEWIQHLRYAGYEFKVLQDGFCVEIQHPYSPFYSRFESSVEGRSSDAKYPNEELFLRFVNELKSRSVRVLYPDCTL